MQKFSQNESYTPRDKKEELLAEAFLTLKNKQEVANFLRDLLTLGEIEEFSNRLEIARLLLRKHSYKRIAQETGVSTTTVTRVAHWVFNGCGGYWNVFKRLLTK